MVKKKYIKNKLKNQKKKKKEKHLVCLQRSIESFLNCPATFCNYFISFFCLFVIPDFHLDHGMAINRLLNACPLASQPNQDIYLTIYSRSTINNCERKEEKNK